MDHRDRLILALSALVRAEREAREAMEAAMAADIFTNDMRDALSGRTMPILADEYMQAAEAFVLPAHAIRLERS